jgi:acyl-CoA thioesterase-1
MRNFGFLLFYAGQRSTKNGAPSRQRKLFLASLAALCAAAWFLHAPEAKADPVRIVAFGDSLTAGQGLPAQDAFPSKLAAALKAKGYDVAIVNAGVSGDTTSAALARLDWSVSAGTQAVILEFGANDAFRGGLPAIVSQNLDEIIRRLKARNIEVLLAGMYAPRNLGADYVAAFDAIYPALAKKYGLILVPFFLKGVAGNAALNQADGIHPTAAGVDVVVKTILPSAEALIQRVRARKAS